MIYVHSSPNLAGRTRGVGGTLAILCVVSTVSLTACMRSANDAGAELYNVAENISIEEYSETTAIIDEINGTVIRPLDASLTQQRLYENEIIRVLRMLENSCRRELGYPQRSPQKSENTSRKNEFYRWNLNDDRSALIGEPGAEPRVVRVPDDIEIGCGDKAKASLSRILGGQDVFSMAERIAFASEYWTKTSTAGMAAMRSIDNCIRDGWVGVRGIGEGPSEEITPLARTALRESYCARETGGIQALYNLEARYERAYMDKYASELERESAWMNTRFTMLNRITEAGDIEADLTAPPSERLLKQR